VPELLNQLNMVTYWRSHCTQQGAVLQWCYEPARWVFR